MANDFATNSDRSARVNRTSLPRKLPLPPSPRPESLQSKRTSRPLPRLPRALICKKCGTCISSQNVLFPASMVPRDSRAFRGFTGKASLFTDAYNITAAPANVQLMTTGAHTMQELTCSGCSTYVGWKIIRAHDKSESWKDGNFLLELEQLVPDNNRPDDLSPNQWRSADSNSDSEYSP